MWTKETVEKREALSIWWSTVTEKRNATTVEPPNKGQVGTSTEVRYSEVVLYWGVFAKNPSFYILVCCISFILHFRTY